MNNYVKRIITSVIFFLLMFYTSLSATGSSVDVKRTEEQMELLAKRYGSLSAAMAENYARNEGLSLKSFMLGKPGAFSDLSGLNPSSITGIRSNNVDITVNDLDMLLQERGLALSSLAYSSIEKAAFEVRSKSKSYDAAVVQAGMSWADTLYKLNVPTLKYPDAPKLDGSVVTSLPSEGLVFGMFTNRALNNFVRDYPDVFSKVSATGIGSDAQLSAWNNSIKQAMTNSRPDLSGMLPGVCGVSFLDGLSGNSSSEGCSPCNAAGLLGNAQLSLIFNPSAGSTIGNNDSTLSPAEWSKLSPKQREAVMSQNPSLASVINGVDGSNGCGALKPSVQNNISSVLPKVLDYLDGKP